MRLPPIAFRVLQAASSVKEAVSFVRDWTNGRRAAAALAILLGIGWSWAWWRYPLPDPSKAAAPTVRLYAGDEEIAALYGSAQRSQLWVPLGEIPRSVVDAVLVTEDRRFFYHWGIDLPAVLRAVAANLRHREIRQGASTITQQLARTLFLNPERSWTRKVRESAIALALEFRYSKARILEAYLNSVYMGHDRGVAVYGVAAAARHFLDKHPAAVRLDEAALLAASIRAPNRIFSGQKAYAEESRNGILRDMRERGMVSEADFREATVRPIQWRAAGPALRAPYFVDLARQEIGSRVALPASGEVRIATSLDPFLLRAAERAIREGLERIEQRRPELPPDKLQAAIVAIEPATGQVRALVGGRSYLQSPYNRAIRAARQPGSLFKPIVYLAAFEAEGGGRGQMLTPASRIMDEPVEVQAEEGIWSPRNMTDQFRGPVTVRRALEDSLNVPAVRVAQDVGLARVVQTARGLGIGTPLVEVPSLALGTSEVTLLEMTSAFATLANQGIRTPPTTFAAEQSQATARIVLSRSPPARAVSAESSFLLTHILRGVMRQGTGRASARWGLSDLTAGKTGSTESLRDAWFVGYTPDLALGVWVGLDDGTPLGLTGAEAALPIWASVMQAAVRRAPPRSFVSPPGVVMLPVDRDTGQRTSVWCSGNATIQEAFKEGTEPEVSGACAETFIRAADFFTRFLGLFR